MPRISIETLDADDAAPAERATTVTRRIARRIRRSRRDVAPRRATRSQADDALAALATVTDRDRMIDVAARVCGGAFQGAVLFTVRDQLAFGWKAIGDLPGTRTSSTC